MIKVLKAGKRFHQAFIKTPSNQNKTSKTDHLIISMGLPYNPRQQNLQKLFQDQEIYKKIIKLQVRTSK